MSRTGTKQLSYSHGYAIAALGRQEDACRESEARAHKEEKDQIDHRK
jgi:hypothetical protein